MSRDPAEPREDDTDPEVWDDDERDDSPYCDCGAATTIEEADSGRCDCCGKLLS